MKLYLIILTCAFSAVYGSHAIPVVGTYTTPFKCKDGSYCLIEGSEVTLNFTYGYSHDQITSFSLHDDTDRAVFEYESAGDVTRTHKTSLTEGGWSWTPSGICLTMTGITKSGDSGKYRGKVVVNSHIGETTVELNTEDIKDPPAEVELTILNNVPKHIQLKPGFSKLSLLALAKPFTNIECCGVVITWFSSETMNSVKSCQPEDVNDPIVCSLTLKESDMSRGCVNLSVSARQYGVHSDNIDYSVCYEDDKDQIVFPNTLKQSDITEGYTPPTVSAKNYGQESDNKVSQVRPQLAILSVILGVVVLILFLLCLIVFMRWKRDLMNRHKPKDEELEEGMKCSPKKSEVTKKMSEEVDSSPGKGGSVDTVATSPDTNKCEPEQKEVEKELTCSPQSSKDTPMMSQEVEAAPGEGGSVDTVSAVDPNNTFELEPEEGEEALKCSPQSSKDTNMMGGSMDTVSAVTSPDGVSPSPDENACLLPGQD